MTTTTPIPNFPSDLVRAVTAEAERDADRVGHFLETLGLRATPERPLPLPSAFLLDLGAALRLQAWEQAGLHPHDIGGLPAAHQAIRDVFLTLLRSSTQTEMDTPSSSLVYRVCQAFAEHFAWSGKHELDADVLLGEADEEAVLEALADFLWAHRPR